MMSTEQSSVNCQMLLQLFQPSQVKGWFQMHDADEGKRRNRRLTPLVLFLGALLYAASGLRNLCQAYSNVLAFLHPNSPPLSLSFGSISPARQRLPLAVLQRGREHLLALAQKIPQRELLSGFQVLCIDGTTFSLADTPQNEVHYGRPKASRGKTGYPRLRSVLVMDAASHLFTHSIHGHYNTTSENSLADQILKQVLQPGFLLEADRNFYSYQRVCSILAREGDLLWRMKNNSKTPILRELEDGSYLTVLFCFAKSRNKGWQNRLFAKLSSLSTEDLIERAREEREALSKRKRGVPQYLLMRVVQYEIVEEEKKKEPFKLLCSVLEPERFPAKEAAEGYHLRWSEEVGIRELKWLRENFQIPHLPGKSPLTVEQDLASLLLSHSVLRMNMLLAAKEHDCDPRRLSLSGTRAVLMRYLPRLPQIGTEALPLWLKQMLKEISRQKNPPPRKRVCPRAVKVKMSGFRAKSGCKMPPSSPRRTKLKLRVPTNAFS